jgi:hypothetical protein
MGGYADGQADNGDNNWGAVGFPKETRYARLIVVDARSPLATTGSCSDGGFENIRPGVGGLSWRIRESKEGSKKWLRQQMKLQHKLSKSNRKEAGEESFFQANDRPHGAEKNGGKNPASAEEEYY